MVVSAFAVVLLFAGARIDGARRLHSPEGMTKRRCADCVEAQPSKSVSMYQSTSPSEMYVISESPVVSPALAKGSPLREIQTRDAAAFAAGIQRNSTSEFVTVASFAGETSVAGCEQGGASMATTDVVTLAVSLFGFESPADVCTATLLVIDPGCDGAKAKTSMALVAFAARKPVQLICADAVVHDHAPPFTAFTATPDGSVSMICAVAPLVPLFVTTTFHAIGSPVFTLEGPCLTTPKSDCGATPAMVMPAAVEAVQPPIETVTSRLTTPDAPAVKRMLFVPIPVVIVPLVIDQPYVAPGCDGTLAELFVEFASTDNGALTLASGVAPGVTVCVPVAVQPLPLVALTL